MAAIKAAGSADNPQPAFRINFVVSGTTLHSPQLSEGAGSCARSFKELRELHCDAVKALGGALAQGSVPYFGPAFSWQSVHTIRGRPVTELDRQLDGSGLVLLDAAAWGSVSCPNCGSDANTSCTSSWSPAAAVPGGPSEAVHTWFIAAKRRVCGECETQWTDRVVDLPLAIVRLLPEPFKAPRSQQVPVGPTGRTASVEAQQPQPQVKQLPAMVDAAVKEEIVIADSPPRPAEPQPSQQQPQQPCGQPQSEHAEGKDSDAVGTLLLLGGPDSGQGTQGTTGGPTGASVVPDQGVVESPLRPAAKYPSQHHEQQEIEISVDARDVSGKLRQAAGVLDTQVASKRQHVAGSNTSGVAGNKQPQAMGTSGLAASKQSQAVGTSAMVASKQPQAVGTSAMVASKQPQAVGTSGLAASKQPQASKAAAEASGPDAAADAEATSLDDTADAPEQPVPAADLGRGRVLRRHRVPSAKAQMNKEIEVSCDAAKVHAVPKPAQPPLPSKVPEREDAKQEGQKRKQVQAGARDPRRQKTGAGQPTGSGPNPPEPDEQDAGPLALVGHVSEPAKQVTQQKAQHAARLQHMQHLLAQQHLQQQQILLSHYGAAGYHPLLPALGLGWPTYILPPMQQQQQQEPNIAAGATEQQHSHQSTLEQLGTGAESEAHVAGDGVCSACLLLLNQVWSVYDPKHSACCAAQLVPHHGALLAAAEAQAREEMRLRAGSVIDSQRYIQKYRSRLQVMSAGVVPE